MNRLKIKLKIQNVETVLGKIISSLHKFYKKLILSRFSTQRSFVFGTFFISWEASFIFIKVIQFFCKKYDWSL